MTDFTLASRGRWVSMSTTIAVMVLIKERQSAPASCAANAISVMSVTLGDSFTINGLVVLSRIPRTTRKAAFGGHTGVGPRYTLENPGFMLRVLSFHELNVMFLAPKRAV